MPSSSALSSSEHTPGLCSLPSTGDLGHSLSGMLFLIRRCADSHSLSLKGRGEQRSTWLPWQVWGHPVQSPSSPCKPPLPACLPPTTADKAICKANPSGFQLTRRNNAFFLPQLQLCTTKHTMDYSLLLHTPIYTRTFLAPRSCHLLPHAKEGYFFL